MRRKEEKEEGKKGGRKKRRKVNEGVNKQIIEKKNKVIHYYSINI